MPSLIRFHYCSEDPVNQSYLENLLPANLELVAAHQRPQLTLIDLDHPPFGVSRPDLVAQAVATPGHVAVHGYHIPADEADALRLSGVILGRKLSRRLMRRLVAAFHCSEKISAKEISIEA
jgi:hypothetical protein